MATRERHTKAYTQKASTHDLFDTLRKELPHQQKNPSGGRSEESGEKRGDIRPPSMACRQTLHFGFDAVGLNGGLPELNSYKRCSRSYFVSPRSISWNVVGSSKNSFTYWIRQGVFRPKFWSLTPPCAVSFLGLWVSIPRSLVVVVLVNYWNYVGLSSRASRATFEVCKVAQHHRSSELEVTNGKKAKNRRLG